MCECTCNYVCVHKPSNFKASYFFSASNILHVQCMKERSVIYTYFTYEYVNVIMCVCISDLVSKRARVFQRLKAQRSCY